MEYLHCFFREDTSGEAYQFKPCVSKSCSFHLRYYSPAHCSHCSFPFIASELKTPHIAGQQITQCISWTSTWRTHQVRLTSLSHARQNPAPSITNITVQSILVIASSPFLPANWELLNLLSPGRLQNVCHWLNDKLLRISYTQWYIIQTKRLNVKGSTSVWP